MVALNNKFDILRGWPNGSAVQEDLIIPSTPNLDTHKFMQGQWVSLKDANDGSMSCVETLAGTASSAIQSCYLIIEGRDDYSSQFANRVTCLLGGGYMVRLPQKGVDSSGAEYDILSLSVANNFSVGQRVKVEGGILHPVADGVIDDDAALDHVSVRDVVVGHVVATNDANNTIDIFVV